MLPAPNTSVAPMNGNANGSEISQALPGPIRFEQSRTATKPARTRS